MASTSTPKSGVGGGSKSSGGSIDTLKNLFMIGHFITNCESLSDLGNSQTEQDGKAAKEEMNKLLGKASEKIKVMREELKQVHGEKQKLENRLGESKTAGVKKDEEIRQLQGKLKCEQGGKLEAMESMDAVMKAIQEFCQNLDPHLEGEPTKLIPSGGRSSKEDEEEVKSALNMISARILGNLQRWKDSENAVEKVVYKCQEAMGEYFDYKQKHYSMLNCCTVLPPTPNQGLDLSKEVTSVGSSKRKTLSELVPGKNVKRPVHNFYQVESQEGAFVCHVCHECGQTYGTEKELHGHQVVDHGMYQPSVPVKSTPGNNEGENGTKTRRVRIKPRPKYYEN